MLALGTALPAFKLPDVRTAATVGSDDFAGSPLLVVFICVHCPYVKRIQDGLAAFGRDYAQTDLADRRHRLQRHRRHPEDSPENQARVADEFGYPFPVLYDETQEVAMAFTAACTPDFFLFGPRPPPRLPGPVRYGPAKQRRPGHRGKSAGRGRFRSGRNGRRRSIRSLRWAARSSGARKPRAYRSGRQ